MIIKKRRKRNVSGLNTTSTADISFILLVFFLVISSMDSNKGIQRQLSPVDNKRGVQITEMDKRNVLEITISESGRITSDGKVIPVEELRKNVEKFVENSKSRATHIVNITMRPSTCYNDYYGVIDAVGSAYSSLRRACAIKLYHKPYAQCSQYERSNIDKLYPQRVMENVE